MLGSEAGLGGNWFLGQNKCKGFGPEGLDREKHSLGGKSGSPWTPGGTCALATHFTLGEMAWGTGWTGLGLWGSWPGQSWGKEHGGVQGGMPGGHKAMVAP